MESSQIIGLILVITIATLTMTMGSIVNDEFSQMACDDWDSANETCLDTNNATDTINEGQNAIQTMAQFLPILGIAGIAVVVIVMFLRGFGGIGARREY